MLPIGGRTARGNSAGDGTAVDLDTVGWVRMFDAVKMVLEHAGHKVEIQLRPDMPTGPLNRVADNSQTKKLLGWEPQVPFQEGLKRTIDRYFATKDRDQVRKILDRMSTER